MLYIQPQHEKGRKMNTIPESDEQLREAVRDRYSRTALEVLNTGQITAESCCSSSCCSPGDSNLVTSELYSSAELGELPTAATLASLGCGNPTALAELKPGEKDLDAWAGCIAGALEEEVYRQLLAEAGFTNIEIEMTRRYSIQDVADSGGSSSIASLTDGERAEIDGKFVSAFIRAQKPF